MTWSWLRPTVALKVTSEQIIPSFPVLHRGPTKCTKAFKLKSHFCWNTQIDLTGLHYMTTGRVTSIRTRSRRGVASGFDRLSKPCPTSKGSLRTINRELHMSQLGVTSPLTLPGSRMDERIMKLKLAIVFRLNHYFTPCYIVKKKTREKRIEQDMSD